MGVAERAEQHLRAFRRLSEMRPYGKRKIGQNGRSLGSPHVRLDDSIFYSASFRALAPLERAMLFELLGLYNGSNNGELWLSLRDAARLVGVAEPETAGNAIKALIEHGLVAVTSPGHFAIKERHATCYRFTFYFTPGAGPTNEYRGWQAPVGSKAADRLIATSKCKLRPEFASLSVGKIRAEAASDAIDSCPPVRLSRAVTETKLEIVENDSVRSIPTHIDFHGVGGGRVSQALCKKLVAKAREWVARQGHGSQQRLAAAAGLSPSKLSRLLSDKNKRRGLTLAQADRLETALLNVRGHRNDH